MRSFPQELANACLKIQLTILYSIIIKYIYLMSPTYDACSCRHVCYIRACFISILYFVKFICVRCFNEDVKHLCACVYCTRLVNCKL